MEVVSLSLLPTRSLVYRPREGRWMFAVVCKATFRLEPGQVAPIVEQEPVFAEESFYDGNPEGSLDRPNDLVPFKPRVDVVLVGSAFAPQRKPARSLVTRLVVGELDKSVEVYGGRTVAPDGSVREGMRWLAMPLRYERAGGGPDTPNPVGMRPEGDAFNPLALPHLVPPGFFSTDPSEPIPPTGYGPIAASWPPRRDKLGARASSWNDREWHKDALGDDFDFAYFQIAPREQQIEALRSDERIVLENMHPEHPRLVTSLPGVEPRAFVDMPGSAPQLLSLKADTLLIDTDRGIVTVTWRGQLQLQKPNQPGVVLVATQGPGQELSWVDVQALRRARGPQRDDATVPTRFGKDIAIKSAPDSPDSSRPAPAVAAQPHFDPDATTEIRADSLQQKPVMPFVPASLVSPVAQRSGETSGTPFKKPARAFDDDEEGTAVLPITALRAEQEKRRAEGRRPFNEEPTRELDIGKLQISKPVMPFGQGAAAPPGPVASTPPVFAPPPAPPAMPPAPPAPPAMPPPPPAMTPPPPAMPPRVPSGFNAPQPPMQPPPMQPPSLSQQPSPPAFVSDPMGDRGRGAPPMEPPGQINYGDVDTRNLSKASYEGVLAASNAAAARGPTLESAGKGPGAAKKPEPEKQARPAGEPIELIWYEPSFVARMRKHPAWAPMFRPPPKPPTPQRGQPPPPPPSPEAAEEATKSDVFSVLSRGEPGPAHDLVPGRPDDGNDRDGHDAALYLLAGTIAFPFDEIEVLKATVAAASPLATSDKKLKEVLDMVDEVMKMPLQGAPEVVQSFTQRVRDAWTSANRLLPPDYLVVHTERMLLNQRHYQKRELLDDEWIRALFTASGEGAAIPAYVPSKLAKRLPLFRQFPARIVVEALPQQDQYEVHPIALRVAALARVLGAAGSGTGTNTNASRGR
jgi:hypothetical protein